MTKIDKKYLADVCDAKDIICTACHNHNKDACEHCPVANIIDNELRRLQKHTSVFDVDMY